VRNTVGTASDLAAPGTPAAYRAARPGTAGAAEAHVVSTTAPTADADVHAAASAAAAAAAAAAATLAAEGVEDDGGCSDDDEAAHVAAAAAEQAAAVSLAALVAAARTARSPNAVTPALTAPATPVAAPVAALDRLPAGVPAAWWVEPPGLFCYGSTYADACTEGDPPAVLEMAARLDALSESDRDTLWGHLADGWMDYCLVTRCGGRCGR
jgi:hypothetical protein